jgi:hypothetical protein
VYKIEPGTSRQPDHHKAHLIAHGFDQQKGINYGEIFAPVAKYNTIKVVNAISASQG